MLQSRRGYRVGTAFRYHCIPVSGGQRSALCMPVRTDEEVREALEAQAHDNANAGELLDILRWSSSGNAAQKRARLLSFLDGPASRRRAGWLDLLLVPWPFAGRCWLGW